MKRTFAAFFAAVLLAGCNSGEVIRKSGSGGATTDADFDRVFEFTPAPGQFVNEKVSGYSGESTAAEAAIYAEKRLRSGLYLSLGGFGGYVVVGFDHDIVNNGGYNLAIGGNQTDTANEPGIVWVMPDDNGNSLPDDTWYELAGSDSGADAAARETVRGYEVTYYRPAAAGQPVIWRDNLGATGEIDYIAASHRQDSYYPSWISADSYTLGGTRLKARNYDRDGDGTYWVNPAYDWGYADNLGSDAVSGGSMEGLPAGMRFTLLKIANAVDADGEPVHLDRIRFVKVQTGVNTKSGWLGEASTEVTAIKDYNRILGNN